MKQMVNGQLVDMTQNEIDEYNERNKAWNDASGDRKLEQIKQMRLQRLQETDYLAMSDNIMSDEIKTYRQSMRDIPQDYSEADYDNLLARDEQGNLTHTVWEKP